MQCKYVPRHQFLRQGFSTRKEKVNIYDKKTFKKTLELRKYTIFGREEGQPGPRKKLSAGLFSTFHHPLAIRMGSPSSLLISIGKPLKSCCLLHLVKLTAQLCPASSGICLPESLSYFNAAH